MSGLNPNDFSTCFHIRRLNEHDLPIIYSLMKGNPLFYKYCGRECNETDILDDMKNLPPQKIMEDKYYVGFFEKNDTSEISKEKQTLVAVLDLIDGYPDEKTAFIGFFMLNNAFQGKGIGTQIISELSSYLKTYGFEKIRLGIDKSNPQSNAFWKKNAFSTIKEVEFENGIIIVAQKVL